MKILLTGAAGQVGAELQQTLQPFGTLVASTRQQLDLSQPDTIVSVIAQLQPDVIVNAAAYTAVDKAETEGSLAQRLNGDAPGELAQVAKDCGAFLLHISTDYVFDGTKGSPYLETDQTNPLGSYGQSKRSGEIKIEAVGGDWCILRTAWVYGTQGTGNFVKTMVHLGKERLQLKVVADQIGSPTWAKDIAEAIALLIDKRGTGIYHYTNSGVASWYDFAVAIFAEAKALGIPLVVEDVQPIATVDYPTPAQRPAYSVLATQKYRQTCNQIPPHWRQSLRQMLQEGQAAGIF